MCLIDTWGMLQGLGGGHLEESVLRVRGRFSVVGEFMLDVRTGCWWGNIVVNFGGDLIHHYDDAAANDDCALCNHYYHRGDHHNIGCRAIRWFPGTVGTYRSRWKRDQGRLCR